MMPSSRKTSSPRDDNEPLLQVTSRQLMGAICILLSAACAIFLAGLIVGRSSSSQSEGMEVAQVPSEQTEVPIAVEPEDPKRDESLEAPTRWTQVSPRRMDENGREDPGEPAQGDGYRDMPAPAPASDKTPEPQADEKAESTPESVTTSDEPKPTEGTTKPEAEPSTKETSADETSGGEAVPESEKETPPQTDKPAAPKGITYAVQVMSVDVSSQAGAEKYAKELEKRIKHKPELILSDDGMRVQVIVGRTSDKKSAEAIQKELRKQDEFKDCWLRTLKAE